MPTPSSWKHFLDKGIFTYERFLNGDNIINLDAVKESLNCLNWHVLRAKRSPIARYTLLTTKSTLARGITNMYNCDNTVLMVWLLLANSSISDFKCKAQHSTLFDEYCRVPLFTHPLSKYYPLRYNLNNFPSVLHFLLDINVLRINI